MSFVPSTHAGPGADETIVNNGFYPDLSLGAFKSRMSIGGDNDAGFLVGVLIAAMIEINHALSDWRATRPETRLRELPGEIYGDIHEKIRLYETAVFNRARANLVESRRDYDSTGAGHDRADALGQTADDYYRTSTEAMNRLMDRPRSTVELI